MRVEEKWNRWARLFVLVSINGGNAKNLGRAGLLFLVYGGKPDGIEDHILLLPLVTIKVVSMSFGICG